MQTEPDNNTQKLVGKITLIVFGVLTLIIGIACYFDGNFSLDPKFNSCYKWGYFVVTEERTDTKQNSYYEDTWTGNKYSSSGNNYKVYALEDLQENNYVKVFKFNTVDFNIKDTVFLFYEEVYKMNGNDSTFAYYKGNMSVSAQQHRINLSQ